MELEIDGKVISSEFGDEDGIRRANAWLDKLKKNSIGREKSHPCYNCGGIDFFIQAGACKVCSNCGTSDGCS